MDEDDLNAHRHDQAGDDEGREQQQLDRPLAPECHPPDGDARRRADHHGGNGRQERDRHAAREAGAHLRRRREDVSPGATAPLRGQEIGPPPCEGGGPDDERNDRQDGEQGPQRDDCRRPDLPSAIDGQPGHRVLNARATPSPPPCEDAPRERAVGDDDTCREPGNHHAHRQRLGPLVQIDIIEPLDRPRPATPSDRCAPSHRAPRTHRR